LRRRQLSALRCAGALFALLWSGQAAAQTVDHVFLVVMEGLRSSEGFGDPAYEYVDPLMSALASEGSLLTSVENRGQTLSLPAHHALVTGTYSDLPDLPPYEDRETFGPRSPTLFEAYRRQSGEPLSSVWVVSNSSLVHDTNHSVVPGFGSDYRAQRNIDYTGTAPDSWVWSTVEQVLGDAEVGLMTITLAEADRFADVGDWDGYTAATLQASQSIRDFWDWVNRRTYASEWAPEAAFP